MKQAREAAKAAGVLQNSLDSAREQRLKNIVRLALMPDSAS